MSRTTKFKQFKRRLGRNWLPFNLLYKSRISDKKTSRVSLKQIALSRRSYLLIYLRSNRTTKASRKKYFLTIPIIRIYGSNLKEIDFQLKKVKKSKKRKTTIRKIQLSKYSYAKILIIIGVVGVGVTLLSLKNESVPANFSTTSSVIPVQTEKPIKDQTSYLDKSKPISLKIPAIGVSSEVITVGKLPDNSMQTPNNGTQVGWYKYSPSPGQIGPSVIVGHVDWINGPAVFWSLKDLKSGDIIKVKRQDKKVVEYKVDKIQQFSQDNFPTKAVYGNTDTPTLRLITCSGTFDSSTYQYDKNIVVFAKAINI